MRRELGRPAGQRSRGVAVLELTLSLVFLIPLMMATLDFGYYFYVGSTAEEAARQALVQAVLMTTPCAAGPVCAPQVNWNVTATANGSGTGCTSNDANANQPPAAACYMNAPPLSMGGASGATTVTCACALLPVNPTYTITVDINFQPAVGYFKYLMPVGTPSTNVLYRARLTGS